MLMMTECCGLRGRPCGDIIEMKITANKEHGVSHGLCRSCYLEMMMENGVATMEEKREIHALLVHHKKLATRAHKRNESKYRKAA